MNRLGNLKGITLLTTLGLATILLTVGIILAQGVITRDQPALVSVIGQLSVHETLVLYPDLNGQPDLANPLGPNDALNFGDVELDAFGNIAGGPPRIPLYVLNNAGSDVTLTVEASGDSPQLMIEVLFGPRGGEISPAPGNATNIGVGQIFTADLGIRFLEAPGIGDYSFVIRFSAESMSPEEQPPLGPISAEFLYTWGGFGGRPTTLSASEGLLYVARDPGSAIYVFDYQGNYIREIGEPGSGNGQLLFANGVDADGSGNVYIAGSGNNRIQVFVTSGLFRAQWGSRGSGDGQFNYPETLVGDGFGLVYVPDRNDRIQVFDESGSLLRVWGGPGPGDGQFSRPSGIALDRRGNVYVSEVWNNRVQVFDSQGNFLRKWGTPGSGQGAFNQPRGIAIDQSGRVYVADMMNHRIQVFDPEGNPLGMWGSQGEGDGQFVHPYDVAVDEDGKVYVLDSNNRRIQVFRIIDTP